MNTKVNMRTVLLSLSTFMLTSGALAQGAKPPLENLQYARSIVDQSFARISALLDRVYGGGHMPGGDWPSPPQDDLPPPRGEEPMPGGMGEGFLDGGSPHFPRVLTIDRTEDDFEIEEDHLENDKVAGYALQGIGTGLTYLGQLIDQANMNYYTPQFWMYQQKACMKASLIIKAAIGGKVSAALPLRGLITPQDFVETEQEAYAVRGQLYCP
jgi:hypothetical protein